MTTDEDHLHSSPHHQGAAVTMVTRARGRADEPVQRDERGTCTCLIIMVLLQHRLSFSGALFNTGLAVKLITFPAPFPPSSPSLPPLHTNTLPHAHSGSPSSRDGEVRGQVPVSAAAISVAHQRYVPHAPSSSQQPLQEARRHQTHRYVSTIATYCTRGSPFFLGKVTALGVLCCFALLFVSPCLLLSSFLLISH